MMPAGAPASRMRRVAACAAALVSLMSVSAFAQEPVVEQWYAALATADRGKFESLLADDAKIRLIDLGVEQTKAEFVDSLDEWEAAMAGATIRHRIEKTAGAVTTVIACYHFPANDVLLRETFLVEAGLIRENIQVEIAESCEAY
ncbi:nuclear transport factor 2 family protein [Mesorhizobium sp. LHD-90]|uniref:nuclear transport factor 2 family protein n=1 Tax=Mesorhizobium sp. LHD-90 TaxID=3071414 RepID=UPI0027DF97B6|nr:nuclear transport factor 2 family protein [Mesorhizobium sp. LHD-90]MDQ6432597.1 nuclear transport factor 2 family protein [Mesorhizobium sp. LHD-90]